LQNVGWFFCICCTYALKNVYSCRNNFTNEMSHDNES